MRFIPHKYQEYAIDRIESHDYSKGGLGLFLEMGLG